MKKTAVLLVVAFSLVSLNAFAVTDGAEKTEKTEISSVKKSAIIKNCETMQQDLKNLQRIDSRTRVYLGRYYESILTKYITPLNVRLVENSLSSDTFINNQNGYNKALNSFRTDFVESQKALEELVATNCKEEPEKFYEKLVEARAKRKIVTEDVAKMRKLISEQIFLAKGLKEKQEALEKKQEALEGQE